MSQREDAGGYGDHATERQRWQNNSDDGTAAMIDDGIVTRIDDDGG